MGREDADTGHRRQASTGTMIVAPGQEDKRQTRITRQNYGGNENNVA